MGSGEGYWELQFSSNWKATEREGEATLPVHCFNEDNIQLNICVGADSLIYKKILWPLGFPQSDVLQIYCMYRFWELKGTRLKEVSFSLLWTGITIFYNSVIENMKGKRKWKGWRLHRPLAKLAEKLMMQKLSQHIEAPNDSVWERQFSNHIAQPGTLLMN